MMKLCLYYLIFLKKKKIKNKKISCRILIDYSEKDIRKLLYLFQDVINNFNDEVIDSKKLTKFLDSSKKKNKDISLFDATKYIINEDLDYTDITQLYELEKVLLPLMIHEKLS